DASRSRASLRRSRYGRRRRGRALSFENLDERNGGRVGGVEAGQLDVERVGVEADRHVEEEAGGERDAVRGGACEADEAGRGIDRPAGRDLAAADRDPDAARYRLGDRPEVGIEVRAVSLDELEGFRRAVAGAERLV